MKLKKLMVSLLLAGATALPMTSANAFFGGWGPWDWFDDDDYYHHGPWGYPGYYGGYPGYYGGYPGYGGWGPFSGW